MPRLKTPAGLNMRIDKEEAQEVFKAIQKQQAAVMVRGALIPLKPIPTIANDEDYEENQIGVLHDGKHVYRDKYGNWWYNLDGQQLKVDGTYYLEVARDCVPSPEEYKEKYSMAKNSKEYVALITGERFQKQKSLPSRPKSEEKTQSIKDVVNNNGGLDYLRQRMKDMGIAR